MKYLLIISMLLLPMFSYGQGWAPIGAEWYYDVTHSFSGDIDYHRIYCDSIFNIKGNNCKRINIDRFGCNNHFSDKLYTYESNDTVFFYNPDIDSFQVLFDFNAFKGDKWKIMIKSFNQLLDTIIVNVDSTGISEINGIFLKKLYVTYEYHFNYESNESEVFQINSVIIEKLGDLEFLINIRDKLSRVCDADYIHSLRCYYDSELGIFSTGLRESCTYEYVWLSDDLHLQEEYPLVHPNPVKDYLVISRNGKRTNYEIYNIEGVLIKNGFGTEIDFTPFIKGIYILIIEIENNIEKTIKIIKH